MVLDDRLVKVEEKEPVPVPFDVLVVRAMVGLELVDQTIPLAVMDAPPSNVILPPEMAELVEISDIAVVVSVGRETMDDVSLRQRIEKPDDLDVPKLNKLAPLEIKLITIAE